LQRALSHALTFLTYHGLEVWLRFFRRYRIPDRARIRAQFARLLAEGEGPLLVCPNHLTLIDSVIAIWALAPAWRYFLRPSAFPWNVPERRNVVRLGLGVRLICYLARCILIVRDGPPEETQKVFEKMRWVLARGDALMIFPEGTRSRKGVVDTESFTYGIGRLMQEVPATRVLCLYLRGLGQAQFSDVPRKGEVFHVEMRVLQPASPHAGLRGQRDLSTQVMRTLVEMEAAYLGRQ
jgi:1-acyl-sn-glycerol-3-phosphate acyltransferase